MNYEKLLDLAIASKLDPKNIDEIIKIIHLEMEKELAKKSGKKNVYGNILKFINHTKKVTEGKKDSLCGVFKGKNGKWYVSDGFGGVEFASLEVKDLPVTNGPEGITDILESFIKTSTEPLEMPTESEVLLSYKKQKAETKISDYSIYIKVGNNYYDPKELAIFLSLLGDVKAMETKSSHQTGMVGTDEEGNRFVLLALNPEALKIRENS